MSTQRVFGRTERTVPYISSRRDDTRKESPEIHESQCRGKYNKAIYIRGSYQALTLPQATSGEGRGPISYTDAPLRQRSRRGT
ncbi:hypothetical protein EVAR_9014_1 [Eumeta japonica]|uniref:Uncharacterized protein n=1 Tax=Eumeta variegata TaxID=151549 RepID=A0A4C1TVU8_EUMVA|nr:hypothetical protein EVAR_9014_1 [Eumeta japonica]